MEALEKLLFNLQTIANIPKGKKITTATQFINIEDGGTLQPIWRTTARDSGIKSSLMVQQVIELIIVISDLMIESKNLFIDEVPQEVVFGIIQLSEREKLLAKIKHIVELLDDSRIGVENLYATYYNDTNIKAVLDPLLKKIDNHVEKQRKILLEMGCVIKPSMHRL